MNLLPPNPRVGKQMMKQIGHGSSIEAGRIAPEFFDWYLDLQRGTNTMRNDGEMVGSAVSALGGVEDELELSEAELRAVTTPTLYLWGADDSYGGAEVAERLVSCQANAELEMLPEAGHLPWLDFPEQTARRTMEFLGG